MKRMSFGIKEMLSRDQMKKIRGGSGHACAVSGGQCEVIINGQWVGGACENSFFGSATSCICSAGDINNTPGPGNCIITD